MERKERKERKGERKNTNEMKRKNSSASRPACHLLSGHPPPPLPTRSGLFDSSCLYRSEPREALVVDSVDESLEDCPVAAAKPG